ncbi:MAG: ABC transporter permease [Rudaea sp.]|uniref:ABC transporter permease n=1 Tax=Rudaea sp. TaxID=2136325 RepID=UPI0039E433FC
MLADLHLALRRLRNAPGFAIAAVFMLALGIGLTAAMIGVVGGVLLRGLPFAHGERLVLVRMDNPAQNALRSPLTVAEAEQFAHGVDGFESLGYFLWSGVTVLDGRGRPREIPSQQVSAGYFEALAPTPVLGRALDADDIRQQRPVAVLSYQEWQNGFGGDPQVLGRRIDPIGDDPLEIVGVMPPSMQTFAAETGLWSPLLERILPQDGARRLDQRLLQMVGRLRPGVPLAQADAALNAQAAALRAAHGLDAAAANWQAHAWPLLDLIVGDARAALWGALALALCVLLIACANVALLVDARAVARRRELALMAALGANSRRLRRGIVLEVTLLAALGVGAGIALAQAGIVALRGLAEGSVPRVDGIVLDARVLALAALLGLATPLVALAAGRLRERGGGSMQAILRGGGKGLVGDGGRQRALPALAMALSTISLIAALAFGIGLWRLQRVDPGFRAGGVHALVMFRESMGADSGAAGPPSWLRFADDVLEHLAALPGAEGAALTSAAPLAGIGSAAADVHAPGRADDAPVLAGVRRVSPGYRALLGIPLLAGRDFGADDRAGAEDVAIVNRTLARRLFGDASPLDRTIDVPLARGGSGSSRCRIVGVVDDIHNAGLRAPPEPEVLVAFAQHPRVAMTFLLRAAPALAGVDAQMADALWRVDPRQSITRQFALSDGVDGELRPAYFFANVVGCFALAALVLAVVGVYAVASLQQRRRVGEFGLRLAIGATPRRLALAVLRDSVRISAAGIGAGLVVAAAALWRFDPTRVVGDVALPPVLACGIAAMALAATLAALLPALRAARVAPMEALRDE